jgi:hypothetical protein
MVNIIFIKNITNYFLVFFDIYIYIYQLVMLKTNQGRDALYY